MDILENPIKVQALNIETKQVESFTCVPCRECKKWIIVNKAYNFCHYCGKKINWELLTNDATLN